MKRIEEEHLAFEFGDQWNVFKFDTHHDYRKGIEKVDETKAIDFLGIYNNELYMIEVKDFRQHRIETRHRLSSGELAIELAQKIRDSLACIIGAYRTSSNSEHWQSYSKLICNKNKTIKVILWLEHDLPDEPKQRRKAEASVRSNVFKQKLTWLTNHVLVCNRGNHKLPDVKVESLPKKA